MDKWVLCVNFMCYRYSPGDPILPVISLDQKE